MSTWRERRARRKADSRWWLDWFWLDIFELGFWIVRGLWWLVRVAFRAFDF